MRATPLFPLLTVLVLLLLGGCATVPTPRPDVPPPVVEVPPAHLTGSEETSALFDNFTAFVTAIDGVTVPAGRAGWNTPLPLRPGLRRIGVEFNRGSFRAQAEITFTAQSEAAYQLRFASDAQVLAKNSYCEFWLVDLGTGQPVTERVRVPLTRSERTQ